MKYGVLWNIKWQECLGGKVCGDVCTSEVILPQVEEKDFLETVSVISHYVEESGRFLLGAWPVKGIRVLVEDWLPLTPRPTKHHHISIK